MLYKTISVPILDYCDIVYDVLTQRDIFRLQKLQNSALQIIGKADRRTSVTELHAEFKLDTLVNRRHKHVTHHAYKGLHDMCPPSFCDLFNELSTTRGTTSTRSHTQGNLVIPNFTSEFSRKNIAYRGPLYWNLLDTEAKQATSFPRFKQLLNGSDMFS